MRCHQLEQELQLSFERKVQETRLFESEKASLERCLEQERGFRFISAGLRALMVESRDICQECLVCVDELTSAMSESNLRRARDTEELLHRLIIISG